MFKRTLLIAAVCLLAGGCQTWPTLSWTGSTEREAIAQLSAYAGLLTQFAEADEEGRERQFTRVSRAFEKDPSDVNKLQFALLLSREGHTHTDLVRAKTLLDELDASASSLNQEMARARKAMIALTAASEGDSAVLARDNKRLRKGLDEAEAKIKALTAIEQKLESPASRAPAPLKSVAP